MGRVKNPRRGSVTDPITAWAEAVVAGNIVQGPHVRNACRRHLHDLEHGASRGLTWDIGAAMRAVEFFPDILRLNGGQFEGRPFELHPSQSFVIGSLFGWLRNDGTRRFRRAYIEIGKGNGKALALDTPIPTPKGWREMRDLQPGDRVFDEHGMPCRVTAATDVLIGRPCFLVRFSDGAEIVADAEHLWSTTALRSGGNKGPKPDDAPRKGVPALRTTRQIGETLTIGPTRSAHPQAKWNHRVEVAGALDLPEADLPIPPYTLGVWLADGNSDDARVTLCEADWDRISGEIEREGVSVAERSRAAGGVRAILGAGGRSQGARGHSLQSKLRALGVLGQKSIPAAYLRASKAQRLALLQGLMDGDGYCSPAGQAELTLCNPRLAEDALELIRSLGIKPTRTISTATLRGRVVGLRRRIQFWPHEIPVFRLDRKLRRQRPSPKTRPLSRGRMIVACEPVASVPVKCISVDSPSCMYLAGREMVPTHNSPLAAGLGMYCLLADGEARAEVYAAASKMDQAKVLYRDAVAMYQQSPALFERLKPSGGADVYNLADFQTGSFFRPIASDKGQSGPRPSCALLDEVHEHRSRTMIEMLERGFKWRRQPLIVMITNSGTDRNSVCWEEHLHAVRVAAGTMTPDEEFAFVGEPVDDSAFSFVCALDKGDDPLEDPGCWVKANPLLGITIQEDYLAGVVKQGKQIPGKLNNILRLHFCVWTDADTAWMSRAALEACLADFDPAEHFGARCYLGLDLSATRDLTALAFLVPTGWVDRDRQDPETGLIHALRLPIFDAWVEAWTPADTLEERAVADQAPYDVWVREGWLNAPPGKLVRYDFVAQRVAEAAHEYDLQALAFDAFAFHRNFEPELQNFGVEVELVEHPQAGRKRSQASGLWMPGSVNLLEQLILEERIRIRRSPLAIAALMSVVIEEDAIGNRWFSKPKAANRIDPAVSLVMAVGVAGDKEQQAGAGNARMTVI